MYSCYKTSLYSVYIACVYVNIYSFYSLLVFDFSALFPFQACSSCSACRQRLAFSHAVSAVPVPTWSKECPSASRQREALARHARLVFNVVHVLLGAPNRSLFSHKWNMAMTWDLYIFFQRFAYDDV